MPSTGRTPVRFFQARRDEWNVTVGPPNFGTVRALNLKDKPGTRIGFKIEGTVIYAKKREQEGVIKHGWNALTGRSKSRKAAAQVALERLAKRVEDLKGPVTSEVMSKLIAVGREVDRSGSISAEALQSLFDCISNAEEAHQKAEAAAARQLCLNTAVKGAARLVLADAQLYVAELGSNVKPPSFRAKAASDFRAFIYETVRANDSEDPPNYELARPFIGQWALASQDDILGDPKAKLLIDSLVKLVMGACKMVVPSDTVQHLPEFTWIDESTFEHHGDRFARVRSLGEGGNASAYLYRCGDQTVVVKESKSKDTEAQAAVLAEALVHAQAQTETGERDHIVSLLGTVQRPDGGTMLVLEHAPNGDAWNIQQLILSRLEKKQISKEDGSHALMTLFADMVKGVAKAHTNGVMHLDLKPENYVVDEKGRSLLIDFGTSRMALADAMKSPVDSPDFSAPELINGLKKEGLITYKADVWSLGVILYELNSPRPSFADGEPVNPRLVRPFPYASFTSEAHTLIHAFAEKDRLGRFRQLELDPMNRLHQLIVLMLDPDPAKRPSLEAVLAHRLIAPYASPATQAQRTIVAGARRLICTQASEEPFRNEAITVSNASGE
ncbi:protein kinase domain-containing protein [Variovorax soli]|uniref:non-specific serine/threonine protein kinase n=1 Tax=Variovorax soli TaxID=376815 RepID=A0ABU1NHP0_9BURK|nr:protein kinase [Variovorax soli]MDR6537540.1 hypothetical protein [Variovorax soli]